MLTFCPQGRNLSYSNYQGLDEEECMVECVCVCNVLVSLLFLHCHRAWLSVYVCVMFLFLYCVYTVTEHG